MSKLKVVLNVKSYNTYSSPPLSIVQYFNIMNNVAYVVATMNSFHIHCSQGSTIQTGYISKNHVMVSTLYTMVATI